MCNWRFGKEATYCLASIALIPSIPVPWEVPHPFSTPTKCRSKSPRFAQPVSSLGHGLFADCIPALVPSPSGTPAPLRAALLLPRKVLGRSGRQARTSDPAGRKKSSPLRVREPDTCPCPQNKKSLPGLAELRGRGSR